MKINNQILSLPPYISTSWKNVNSLSVDLSGNLIILLHSNAKIIIPNLEKSVINVIFDAHAKYIEQETSPKKGGDFLGSPFLKIGAEGIESLGSAMQHNPLQANAPDLPKDILEKIVSITKAMNIETDIMPKPEANCNCVHCQLARALRGESRNKETTDEEVTEEDLKFRTWDIEQIDEKLYRVTNPLDNNEHYSVYLGSPVGCTCGEKNCEHIKAVLNS